MLPPPRRHAATWMLWTFCVALSACTNEPSEPRQTGSTQLLKVSGDGQRGDVGTVLASPLVVRLVDQDGRPMPNQIVRFEVGTGGGRVAPEIGTTDSAGEAQSQWTLGLSAGGQTTLARADGLTESPVIFSADATGVCTDQGLALRTSFAGIDDGSPSPDATIAAGPASLVLARNSSIALRHKTGALLDQKTIADFFVSVRTAGANRLTDPYVIYDPTSTRFFVANADGIQDCMPGSCPAMILFAVSKSSEPKSLTASDWFFYSFDRNRNITATGTPPPDSQWSDFDHLGVTTDLLVIGMPSVGSAKIRVLDKARLVRGEPVDTWIDFLELPAQPIPALGGVTNRLFVFFRANCSQTAQLVIGAVEGTPSAPTLTMASATTPNPCFPGAEPLAAEQPAGPPVDVVYFNVAPAQSAARLWIARTIGVSAGSSAITGIRWTEVDVSAWPAVSVVQEGTVSGNLWRYTPALTVDPMNNLAMIYAGSNATTFAGAYYTGRLAADALNTLRAERVLRAGTTTHQHVQSGRNRFTDYFAAVTDPVDQSFWIMGMYATGGSGSGTWVGNLVVCR